MSSFTSLSLRRRTVLQALVAVACVAASTATWAEGWPSRPVKIVVPFAPGAGTDAMGRLVAAKLSDLFKASVVVENRTGASGAIGAQEVAKAAPDGHTLLLAAAPFTTVPAALPGAGYDPLAYAGAIGLYAGTAELSAMWRAERSFIPSMSRDQAGSLMAKWEHAVRQTVLP